MTLFKKSGPRLPGGDVLTVVGAEAFLHGSVTVRGSVRIDGEIEGNVTEAHEVVVSGHGKVRGNICADSVEIGGEVRGDIVASERIEFKAGGKVIGNIRTPKLVVEESAVFEGQCVMAAGADVSPAESVSEVG